MLFISVGPPCTLEILTTTKQLPGIRNKIYWKSTTDENIKSLPAKAARSKNIPSWTLGRRLDLPTTAKNDPENCLISINVDEQDWKAFCCQAALNWKLSSPQSPSLQQTD